MVHLPVLQTDSGAYCRLFERRMGNIKGLTFYPFHDPERQRDQQNNQNCTAIIG